MILDGYKPRFDRLRLLLNLKCLFYETHPHTYTHKHVSHCASRSPSPPVLSPGLTPSLAPLSQETLGDFAFEFIDEITDEDRAHSPAVMSAIGSVFCSGTRSPY